jgi:hypothetical protein
MTSAQKWLLALNVAGGCLVLGSYAYGILTHDSPSDKLWGATSAAIRPWYGVSMLLAALGYFAFLYHLLFAVDPAAAVPPGGFSILLLVFALILIPSAFWMALTFHHAEHPGPWTWSAVRGVLALTALGSIALVVCLVWMRPMPVTTSWILALVGAAVFAFHTAVLDALLWPVLYRG